MTTNKRAKGFTIIEIVTVMAIFTIVMGAGLFFSIGYYKTYSLGSERDLLLGVIRKARSLSLNNFNQAAHGVFIEPNSYTIFQGNSFASRLPSLDEKYIASPAIQISGLSEIVFSELDASSNASGTIALSNGDKSLTLSVNYEGRIDW